MGIYPRDPFVGIDEEGVGELVAIAAERGRRVRPDMKLGICGEHGGDPALDRLLRGAEARLRQLLALSRADRAAGGGASGVDRRRSKKGLRRAGPCGPAPILWMAAFGGLAACRLWSLDRAKLSLTIRLPKRPRSRRCWHERRLLRSYACRELSQPPLAVQQCMLDHAYPVQLKRFPALNGGHVVTDGAARDCRRQRRVPRR